MLNEKAVQDIVKEVVAKLNLGAEVETGMGIFTDMNEAIAAAKKAPEARPLFAPDTQCL